MTTTNYFKVTKTKQTPLGARVDFEAFHFFSDQSEPATRDAWVAAAKDAREWAASLSVFRWPRRTGPWRGVPVVGDWFGEDDDAGEAS